jgi:hypothetical protein
VSKQRLILAIACALALALLVGCEQDEIHRYQVPRVETPRPRASAPKDMPERNAAKPPHMTYTVPDGWNQSADLVPMSVLTFVIGDGNQQAKCTVSPFRGPAGGLLANVNRWRGQVGLGPTDEDHIPKEVREIEVAGQPAYYVDLSGPEAAGDKRQRILSVMLLRDEQTWVFVIRGPAALVGRQKDAFEAFVGSVRFE